MDEKMELEMLNAQSRQRVAEAEAEASKKQLKAERKAARKKEFTANMVRFAAACLGVSTVAYMLGNTGAITAAAATAVTNAALCLSCYRVGVWFGWVVKK